jgi:hypothetical protein
LRKGCFIDRGQRPKTRQILQVIGKKRREWEELCRYLASEFQAREELKFYGTNYGWALRFRKGGKALASLYPDRDGFTVQVVLPESDVQTAATWELGRNVKEVLENAHPFPEGRWLFVRVKSRKDLLDVRRLIALKSGREPDPV